MSEFIDDLAPGDLLVYKRAGTLFYLVLGIQPENHITCLELLNDHLEIYDVKLTANINEQFRCKFWEKL